MALPAPPAKLLGPNPPAPDASPSAPLSRAPAGSPEARAPDGPTGPPGPRTEGPSASSPQNGPTGDAASPATDPCLVNSAPQPDAASTGFRIVIGHRGQAIAVPASAGPAVILDENAQNVAPRGKPTFGKRHFRVRQQIRDRLRCWQRSGLTLWWMTLTSSPESPPDRLRRDFQAWRNRLARHLEIDRRDVQYVMVDTAEGHGVLHFLCALPADAGWLSYKHLGQWWQEIHGARQVRFVPLRKGDGTARRLSHYMVSQYMVTQGNGREDLLGRLSGSRMALPLASLRRQVLALFVSPGHVRERLRALVATECNGITPDDDAFRQLIRRATSACWHAFRDGWGQLLQRSWLATAAGDRWVLLPGMTAIEPL